MAQHDSETRESKAVLLVGSGRRARETGAVLATLSGLDEAGERRAEPWREMGVADLEELLTQRPLEGLLILESGRIPGEDIGFVRRFLERHPGWRMLVLGEDKESARALLALDRAQWIAWPPDLGQLRALLVQGAAPAPASPPRAEKARARPGRRAPPTTNGGVEIGGLLEELLAGAALHGDTTPRFQFRGEPFLVHHERARLQEGLAGLVELARQCAGANGLVRAELDPSEEGIVVGLDFPRGGLGEKDLPGLLAGGAAPAEPGLAESFAAARSGVELLREIGGEVALGKGDAGRVRCEVRLAAAAPGGGRAPSGKPEDPFA